MDNKLGAISAYINRMIDVLEGDLKAVSYSSSQLAQPQTLLNTITKMAKKLPNSRDILQELGKIQVLLNQLLQALNKFENGTEGDFEEYYNVLISGEHRNKLLSELDVSVMKIKKATSGS